MQGLTRARDLEPRNADVLRALGEYYRQDDPGKAKEMLRAAVPPRPMTGGHTSRSDLALRPGGLRRGDQGMGAGAHADPDNILVLRNLGGVYHAVDRTDDAATVFQRALEIEPQATIYNNLATMRFFQGRYRRGGSRVREGDRAEPDLLPVLGQPRRHDTAGCPGQEQKAREAFTTAIG